MASINHILLDLLAHHLRADVAVTEKRIAERTDFIHCIDILVREERRKMLGLGNQAYMSDPYKDARREHSALIRRRRETVEDIQYLDVDRASSSNTLCDIEHLQYEARAASKLV
jgi:hypothetical protein